LAHSGSHRSSLTTSPEGYSEDGKLLVRITGKTTRQVVASGLAFLDRHLQNEGLQLQQLCCGAPKLSCSIANVCT
jgi:hypothetical protein